ncbi:MAG: DUF2934 domain-containing protein [Candidatus Omnitrophica bacterium]|nr:DUF2934 domain-containing protein [Candidatus Omnitrophota bacterium]
MATAQNNKMSTKSKKVSAVKVSPKIEKTELELNPSDILKLVEKKAYELYEQRGCQDGFADVDWQEAERIVAKEIKASKKRSKVD